MQPWPKPSLPTHIPKADIPRSRESYGIPYIRERLDKWIDKRFSGQERLEIRMIIEVAGSCGLGRDLEQANRLLDALEKELPPQIASTKIDIK